eukprot:UN07332
MDRIYQYEFLCSDMRIFSLSPQQYVESTTVLHWWVDQPIEQLSDDNENDENEYYDDDNKNNNLQNNIQDKNENQNQK